MADGALTFKDSTVPMSSAGVAKRAVIRISEMFLFFLRLIRRSPSLTSLGRMHRKDRDTRVQAMGDGHAWPQGPVAVAC